MPADKRYLNQRVKESVGDVNAFNLRTLKNN